MVGLPIKTQEGYKVLCYRLSDTDPSKVNFANAVKAFCMFNDMMISQDGIIEGYIVVFDMKGLRLGHLAKIQLSALRTFMAYIQVSDGQLFYLLNKSLTNTPFSALTGSPSSSSEEDLCCSCGGIYQPGNGYSEASDQVGTARTALVHLQGTEGPIPTRPVARGEEQFRY